MSGRSADLRSVWRTFPADCVESPAEGVLRERSRGFPAKRTDQPLKGITSGWPTSRELTASVNTNALLAIYPSECQHKFARAGLLPTQRDSICPVTALTRHNAHRSGVNQQGSLRCHRRKPSCRRVRISICPLYPPALPPVSNSMMTTAIE